MEEYYEKLCKKFPQISFNTNGGVVPCNSNKVVVNLSYDCLKKMANDPEFAKRNRMEFIRRGCRNSQAVVTVTQYNMPQKGHFYRKAKTGEYLAFCPGKRRTVPAGVVRLPDFPERSIT